DELASLFFRIAVAQAVPQAASQFDDAVRVTEYAAKFSRETVQLAYQICAQGRADLALAPDEATGFAMTLLRLWAFEPAPAEGERAARAAKAAVPVAVAPSPQRSAAPASTRAQAMPSNV